MPRLQFPFSAVLITLVSGICLVALPATGESSLDQLRAAVETLILPNAEEGVTTGIVIADGITGQVFYQTDDADTALAPASNMKLLTTAVALHRLGADYTLDTVLAVGGDDLYLIGGGDPALGDTALAEDRGLPMTADLDAFALALRQAGVVRIPGDLIVIDAVFDDQLTHPTWGEYNTRQWYGAPVAGVNLNTNCVDFTFLPADDQKSAATVQTHPLAGGFKLQGRVETTSDVKKHNPILGIRTTADSPGTTFTVNGAVARRAGPYSKPVDDPLYFAGRALLDTLDREGITLDGQVRTARSLPPTTVELREIHRHRTPLPDVLRRVNANSQNMMAEALAKLAGLDYLRNLSSTTPPVSPADQRGSWAAFHLASVDFLKQINLDTLPVVCADGSGLSRENRLSARTLAGLLTVMLRHPDGRTYLDSLGVSGVRGSITRRLTDLKGRVYAKTGTINRVSALSGYVIASDDRVVVFSILHNGFKSGATPYRTQQDEIVRAIADWLETQTPDPRRPPEVPVPVERTLESVAGD